jgi:hypothetical protein
MTVSRSVSSGQAATVEPPESAVAEVSLGEPRWPVAVALLAYMALNSFHLDPGGPRQP